MNPLENENSPGEQTQLDPVESIPCEEPKSNIVSTKEKSSDLIVDRVWGILKRKIDFNREYLLEYRVINGIKDLYTIGRGHLCDIKVDHRLISSTHCKIYCDYSNPKMRIFIEDTSSNGTFINDSLTRLSKGTCMELRSGDEIFLVNPRKITDSNDSLATSFTFINIRDRLAANREISTAPLQRPESLNPKNERSIEDYYIIGDSIGSGMSGQVYFCINRLTKQKCAVKVIDIRKFSLTPGLSIQDLQREAEIMMQLNHPNIIQVYDTFQTNSAIYIVMELVEGGDLFDKIVEKESLSEPTARAIMKNILSAIEYLHSKKIIHRDLKPENILLVSDQDETTVKVTDFGLAKKVSQEGLRTFCGTPQYFAPEVLKRKDSLRGMGRYGMSADMWSIGVILYIMLSGNFPFEEDNLYNHIEKAQYNFSSSIWNSISSSAKHFIKSLLTTRPEDRLSINQALKHPWIMNTDLSSYSLDKGIPFQSKESLKSNCQAPISNDVKIQKQENNIVHQDQSNSNSNVPLLPYQSNLVPSKSTGNKKQKVENIICQKEVKYFRFSLPNDTSYIAEDKEVSGDEIDSFSSDDDIYLGKDQINNSNSKLPLPSKSVKNDPTSKGKKRKVPSKNKEIEKNSLGAKILSPEKSINNKENDQLQPNPSTRVKNNLLRTPMNSLAILFKSHPSNSESPKI